MPAPSPRSPVPGRGAWASAAREPQLPPATTTTATTTPATTAAAATTATAAPLPPVARSRQQHTSQAAAAAATDFRRQLPLPGRQPQAAAPATATAPAAAVSVSKRAKASSDIEAGAGPGGAAASQGSSWAWGSKKLKILLIVAAVVLVASIATAVAVGVTQGKSKGSSSSTPSPSPAPQPSPSPSPSAPVPSPASAGPPPPLSSPSPSPSPPPSADPTSPPPPLSDAPSPPPPAPTTTTTITAPFTVPEGSTALWWDEFEGDALDASKWAVEGAGSTEVGAGQLQVYSSSTDNLRVDGGSLLITALQDGAGGYTSGRINSKPSGSWFPGMQLPDGTTLSSLHAEARVQVPGAGQGLWAAFWMSPPDMKYGGWPASGEIDIMGAINSMDSITQGLHYGGQWPNNKLSDVVTKQSSGQPYSDAFHTYSVDWTPDTITMSIDGVDIKRWSSRAVDPVDGWYTEAAGASAQAPFDIPFSIILNLAVGGSWPGAPDASTPFPSTMTVDYVRVWGSVE